MFFFAFFVLSLTALSEADATLALCHNVLFVQSRYVMLRDSYLAVIFYILVTMSIVFARNHKNAH